MCYVEKGETILIDNQEFFVNDSRPRCGIVDKQTIIELEVGFTKEIFKKKQVLADQRFAEKIQLRDGASTAQNQINSIIHRSRGSHASQVRQAEGLDEIEQLLNYNHGQG